MFFQVFSPAIRKILPIVQESGVPAMEILLGTTKTGKFIERLNRFVGLVELEGQPCRAHIATSGRLRELLVPGATVLLEKSASLERKTGYSLKAVEHGGHWVSIDAQLPNRLLEKALRQRALSPFADCTVLQREPGLGEGRLDFLLQGQDGKVWLEVKSVTLVENRAALFPDAPTERGRRHLLELAGTVTSGDRAAVVFVIQREDADYFCPNDRTDPAFARALDFAVRLGVQVYAYRCRVDTARVTLAERVPVLV